MSADQATILAEISEMLHAVLKEYDPDTEIAMDTTFRGDLEMESIDVVSLAGRLQARYGNAVNFAQFVANLDLESVRTLTVGQLVEYIEASLTAAESAEAAGDPVEAVTR